MHGDTPLTPSHPTLAATPCAPRFWRLPDPRPIYELHTPFRWLHFSDYHDEGNRWVMWYHGQDTGWKEESEGVMDIGTGR